MPGNNKTKKTILIVADTLFYPVRRNGVSIRFHTLISEFNKRGHVIDLIVIDRFKENHKPDDIHALSNICNNVDIIQPDHNRTGFLQKTLKRIINKLHLIIPFGVPYDLIDINYNYSRGIVANILKSRQKYNVGIGVGVGGMNAHMLLSFTSEIKPDHIICDFIDSAYLLRKRRESKTFLSSINIIAKLENIKTRWWENALCRRSKCVYISEKDALTARNGSHIIPNCINDEGYSIASPVSLNTPNIGFLGNMAYPPNIESSLYLTDTLFPSLQKVIPGINVYIIGRYPNKQLQDRGSNEYIHITGGVDNIWDYIKAIDVFVFPIHSGAGLQNKVIEAMYAGKPVITSTIGNEGINAVHSKDLYIANSAEEYINFIRIALDNKNATGESARSFIEKNFSIQSFVNKYEELIYGKNQ